MFEVFWEGSRFYWDYFVRPVSILLDLMILPFVCETGQSAVLGRDTSKTYRQYRGF